MEERERLSSLFGEGRILEATVKMTSFTSCTAFGTIPERRACQGIRHQGDDTKKRIQRGRGREPSLERETQTGVPCQSGTLDFQTRREDEHQPGMRTTGCLGR